MQHPVTGIAGNELHIAGLCDSNQNSIARPPS
jgi:hypothetical protein